MKDFSQDIQNFKNYGTYDYDFDNSGNLTFNNSSSDFNQIYLSLPLLNVNYNNSKISSFYNVQFQEFFTQSLSNEITSSNTTSLEQQLSSSANQNTMLQTQLNALVEQMSISSGSASALAVKQVILELRIALGQGSVDSDFSPTFPYTPIFNTTGSN